MKYRSDFVTNSSSSSFLVSRRDDCTEQDVRDALYKLEPAIIEYFRSYSYEPDEEDVGELFDQLVAEIYDTPGEDRQGHWETFISEYTNQGEGPMSGFIYEQYPALQSSVFKVQRLERI